MTRGRGGRKGPANFGQWRRVPLYFERHRIKEPRRQLMRSAIQIADLLDELGQLPSEVAAALMYMFGNGLGKSRATRNGEARRTAEWRGVLLSTGEVGIASKIEELGRGRKAKAGQLVRLLDVPADSGKGRGLFDDCQGGPAAEFAQRLRVNAMTTYGTAGPAFVAHLAHSFGQDLKQCKSHCMQEIGGSEGQVTRASPGLTAKSADRAFAGQLNARKVATAVFVECLFYEQFYLLRRISLAIPRGDFATGGGKQGFGEFDFQIIVVKGGCGKTCCGYIRRFRSQSLVAGQSRWSSGREDLSRISLIRAETARCRTNSCGQYRGSARILSFH
jgi:Domain of unknown function (DUF927)